MRTACMRSAPPPARACRNSGPACAGSVALDVRWLPWLRRRALRGAQPPSAGASIHRLGGDTQRRDRRRPGELPGGLRAGGCRNLNEPRRQFACTSTQHPSCPCRLARGKVSPWLPRSGHALCVRHWSLCVRARVQCIAVFTRVASTDDAQDRARRAPAHAATPARSRAR